MVTHSQPFLVKKHENDNFETIKFDTWYFNKNTYIVSPMGSGKTDLLTSWISEHFENKNILYVTF